MQDYTDRSGILKDILNYFLVLKVLPRLAKFDAIGVRKKQSLMKLLI